MSTTIHLYQHLLEKFTSYSLEELIELNNETVKGNGWGSTKATFRTAILAAFSKKGVDLSKIISKEDGFTSVKSVPVRLEQNALIPITF
ncbi:5-oxoprolinase [Sphingobacterium rhinopitheci]|uniref:5-oxoprolinase n=1 Tax=Sphingobacterium rhinopitheci TaxID=2781960 RepID=UPI001F523020|nr:5-oxoprolinase [Sphingobacterium rhinopitheci]MCI0921059.1 5-oxoprolinase [Sphingobacterium rhinopitheci]